MNTWFSKLIVPISSSSSSASVSLMMAMLSTPIDLFFGIGNTGWGSCWIPAMDFFFCWVLNTDWGNYSLFSSFSRFSIVSWALSSYTVIIDAFLSTIPNLLTPDTSVPLIVVGSALFTCRPVNKFLAKSGSICVLTEWAMDLAPCAIDIYPWEIGLSYGNTLAGDTVDSAYTLVGYTLDSA